MATVFPFAESFTRYKVASASDPDLFNNLVSRYTQIGGFSGVNITTGGRTGQGLRLNFGSGLTKTFPHSSRFVCGFAYNSAFIFGNDVFYQISNNTNVVFSLRQNADGTLTMFSDTGANIIGTSTRALHADHWYYIEIEIALSGSAPIVCNGTLRINGHEEASGSANTVYNISQMLSGAADCNYHSIAGVSGPAGAGGNVWDDWYVKNTTGFYGDVRIIGLFPDGDGMVLDWTPISGTIHYLMVNSHPVDLTKYLFDITPNDIDTWNWQDAPGFSGTIKAVNIGMDARKDNEGTKSFKIVVGDLGTELLSDEYFVSDLTPEYYEMGMETDPATGVAWTVAGFNAKQFGVKVIQ